MLAELNYSLFFFFSFHYMFLPIRPRNGRIVALCVFPPCHGSNGREGVDRGSNMRIRGSFMMTFDRDILLYVCVWPWGRQSGHERMPVDVCVEARPTGGT